MEKTISIASVIIGVLFLWAAYGVSTSPSGTAGIGVMVLGLIGVSAIAAGIGGLRSVAKDPRRRLRELHTDQSSSQASPAYAQEHQQLVQTLFQDLKPILDALEKKKAASGARFRLFFILGTASFILSMFMVKLTDQFLVPFVVLTIISAIISRPDLAIADNFSMIKSFKSEITFHVLKTIAPELSYSTHGIDRDKFKFAELFDSSQIAKFSSEDLFRGRIAGVPCMFCEVTAEKRRKQTGDSTTVHYDTIFKGSFLAAQMFADCQAHILIVPDRAEQFLGKIGQALGGAVDLTKSLLFSSQLQLVRLDDPRFESAFKVLTNNPDEAIRVLNDRVRSAFLHIHQQYSSSLRLSIKHGTLFVAYPHDYNMFEPCLEKPLNRPETISGLIHEVQIFKGIMEALVAAKTDLQQSS